MKLTLAYWTNCIFVGDVYRCLLFFFLLFVVDADIRLTIGDTFAEPAVIENIGFVVKMSMQFLSILRMQTFLFNECVLFQNLDRSRAI